MDLTGINGVDIDFKYDTIKVDNNSIFGTREGSNDKRFGLTLYSSGAYYHVMPPGSNTINCDVYRHTYTHGEKYNWIASIDGNPVCTSQSKYTNNVTMYLFAEYNNGSVNFYSKSRIYSAKFYSGEKLISNLIPCYNKTTGKLGMYDSIRKRFFTNSGSGEFKSGPILIDKANVEFLESIECTGTQYIDTGYFMTPDSKVTVKQQFL